MLGKKIIGAAFVCAAMMPTAIFAQTTATAPVYNAPKEVIDKIKDEGMNRSQVMKTISYMTDVIGPRLTGSPGLKRANEWTRDQLTSYGLQNGRLESWGPFGRGWTLKRFTAMVDGPTAFPLIAYPKAWSPGTDSLMPKPAATPAPKKGKTPPPAAAPTSTAFTGEVVTFNAQNEAELEQYKGKLKGKIVLVGAMRELKPEMVPQGTRHDEKSLLDLANAPDPNAPRPAGAAPNQPQGNFQQQMQFGSRRFRFLHEEGAAILIDTGFKGDGGTIFVQGAQAVPNPPPAAGSTPTPNPNVRSKEAKVPVQLVATPEHFNRVSRMISAGEKVTMTVDLAVDFQDADENAYNTVAEIPGSDKAEEVVMLGGHLDSWHSGTGATDNAAGCAVMMEAVRIIQALGLKPRRTIRIALWTGEEQGLLGSRAYVRQHLGYRGDGTTPQFGGGGQGAAQLALTKLPDYDKFAAYYNIDNGTGKIRGVYMQGNEKARPIFRQWLAPFKEMGANTLSIGNTGGTDHLAFDSVGLPGFQFIQDEVEYSTRTHHSNMDSYDRIQADDMKQMAIILAAFVYQTAMMDERFPRK